LWKALYQPGSLSIKFKVRFLMEWSIWYDILLITLFFIVIYVHHKTKISDLKSKYDKIYKNEYQRVIAESSRSIQKHEAKAAKSVEKNRKLEKDATMYFYYSPSQARINRNNQLERHTTYIKNFINGKEFTEMLHISQPQVPSFSDAERVFSGKPEIESIPYSILDKPISDQGKVG